MAGTTCHTEHLSRHPSCDSNFCHLVEKPSGRGRAFRERGVATTILPRTWFISPKDMATLFTAVSTTTRYGTCTFCLHVPVLISALTTYTAGHLTHLLSTSCGEQHHLKFPAPSAPSPERVFALRPFLLPPHSRWFAGSGALSSPCDATTSPPRGSFALDYVWTSPLFLRVRCIQAASIRAWVSPFGVPWRFLAAR